MKEITGNIFDQQCDAICITTNGIVKLVDGKFLAVMGLGLAKQAADQFSGLQEELANQIRENGHHTQVIRLKDHSTPYNIVSLPIKTHYRLSSKLDLVIQSIMELVELTNSRNWQNVVLPRPGCGLGRLPWNHVKYICEQHLDDRFSIITPQ